MSMSTPINRIRNNDAGNGVQPSSGGFPPELMPTMQMPMQTPIYNPNVDMSQASSPQSNDMLVDSILQAMESPGEHHQMDTNVGNINYAMDSVAHIPPPRSQKNEQLLKAEKTRTPTVNNANNSTIIDEYTDTGDSMLNKVLKELKAVIIVFVIVFLLSLSQTNRLIFNMFPQLILENGELSVMAILLRSAIAGVLFYVANKYIPL